jgi:2-polyprenyl-6-methoxyphenol hydroxylase-like FAD-dependent oxidoreductase
VDPEVGRHDTGKFLFINLKTLETKFRIPPNERRRVNREKFRKALFDGVKEHIHWGRKLVYVRTQVESKEEGVTAYFEDGTSADGTLLIGAEGSNSQTRQFVAPNTYHNEPIPVRFVGVALEMTPSQVKPFRDIDPLLFQGCHPETANYLWVSMMSTPESNGSSGTENEHYLVQINISWLKDGVVETEANTNASRLEEMRRRADDFHPLLRDAIHSIPDGTPVIEVAMQDWPCLPWDNHDGRITLVGDSAHAMSMYRGEAANHGILDAQHLATAISKAYSGKISMKTAIDQYEHEMRERTSVAVLLSRQACLDAHDYNGLNENSAVLRRRALK